MIKTVISLFVVGAFFLLHVTKISMPKKYSGWIFAIEKPNTPENDYYKVNSKGIVYIPKQTEYKDSTKLRLFDSDHKDVSSHVKLFQVSDYQKKGEKNPLGVYIFYYPTPEELKLPEEKWTEREFVRPYDAKMLELHRKLKDSGYLE
jgi:hypothetical protein